MSLVDTEFQRIFLKDLNELYVERRDQLARGDCIWAADVAHDYNHRAGYLAAIRDVKKMVETVAKKLNGEDVQNESGS